jgi:hypothetical protein
MIKPSHLVQTYPFASIFSKSEYETIALNIIKILSNTGDEWRTLDWFEYLNIRHKDGNFTMAEKYYFDRVITYTTSPEQAAKFSEDWAVLISSN